MHKAGRARAGRFQASTIHDRGLRAGPSERGV